MKINYNMIDQVYSYSQLDKEEIGKLNFVLANSRGDFLNLGVKGNSFKYQGYFMFDSKSFELFKFIDELILDSLDVDEVEYGSYYAQRKFSSRLSENLRIPISDISNKHDEVFGDEGKLEYSENGALQEVVESENILSPRDRFYLGPSGGMVYEVYDYEGKINVDLDISKLNDFDEWGREYDVYSKNGIIYVKYTKRVGDKADYELFFGMKAVNFSYEFVKEFVKKDYPYSKRRNSLHERYVYRLLNFDVSGYKKILFGCGYSEEDVFEQIGLLDVHQNELESFDRAFFKDFLSGEVFEKPITQDFLVAYKLSNNAMYKFLVKGLESSKIESASYAGFSWFTQFWARDELVGLRSYINNSDEKHVKEKLFDYLESIDFESGVLKRIDKEGSLSSPDACFWLAKRFEDFIFHLDREMRLPYVMTEGELLRVYERFHFMFSKIVENYWDKDEELLKVNFGDSWMDTIDMDYPLDVQVQFLGFVSFILVLGNILGKQEEILDIQDFETLLKGKIRESYFRGGNLYCEAFTEKLDSNIFLAYYFYPDLFTQSDWEKIFDNALMHLWNDWGGISSISKKDSRFVGEYSGEDNKSYHLGDSWFFINNIATIVLHDVNEKKYRQYITKMMRATTDDILKRGTVGFGSELSSSNSQKAEGNLAQMWSSSTYIEMIDKVFERK